MTIQRDRLAAVLTEAAAYVSPATHGRPERIEHQLWLAGAIASIDALLARGVRVVSPADYVSPLKMEQPALAEPVSFGLNGLETTFKVSFHRHERQRCANCAKRRVVFDVGLGDLIASPRICARCAGIR